MAVLLTAAHSLGCLAVRRADDAGTTVDQARAAIGVGCCLGEVPSAVRALAWEAGNAWAATERRSPGA